MLPITKFHLQKPSVRQVDNLLLAGRLISGDFYTHSSYRVTGDAAAIGVAAGTEAAMKCGYTI